jgi:hypothetical protein
VVVAAANLDSWQMNTQIVVVECASKKHAVVVVHYSYHSSVEKLIDHANVCVLA